MSNSLSAPPPDLRIIDIHSVLPHEKSDLQRSTPLIEQLRHAEYFTNPPVVASIDDSQYVLMDGANRHNSLKHLGFDHILVQIADYNTDFISLGVWQHVVSDWDSKHFVQLLEQIPGIEIRNGWNGKAVAHILLHEGPVYGIHAKIDSLIERNRTLCQVVETYHHHAILYRTPHTDPTHIWSLYPSGIALVMFPTYEPQHIIEAAVNEAFLPPGVSRHIINGRALRLNYPMERLRADLPLEDKNEHLQQWVREKLATRSVRYYAESTYQFDE